MIAFAGDDEPSANSYFSVGSSSSFECDQSVLLQRTGMAGQTADQWSNILTIRVASHA
jgi:hypothetical protein